MPKRWKITRGSKHRVELVEVDNANKVIEVYAQTKFKWGKQEEADAVIKEFRGADVIYPGEDADSSA